jgi:hypothetical protein
MKKNSKKELAWELCENVIVRDKHIDPREVKGVLIGTPYFCSPHLVDQFIEIKVQAGKLRYNKENEWYEVV